LLDIHSKGKPSSGALLSRRRDGEEIVRFASATLQKTSSSQQVKKGGGGGTGEIRKNVERFIREDHPSEEAEGTAM